MFLPAGSRVIDVEADQHLFSTVASIAVVSESRARMGLSERRRNRAVRTGGMPTRCPDLHSMALCPARRQTTTGRNAQSDLRMALCPVRTDIPRQVEMPSLT